MTSAELEWRKSSYTGGNGNCVEVAWPGQVGVAVRDSKQPAGGILSVSSSAWRTFVARTK